MCWYVTIAVVMLIDLQLLVATPSAPGCHGDRSYPLYDCMKKEV